MSGRRSKKNQRLGSSRRGPKGLNSNIEKDDDGFQRIAESEDGRNEFHTSTDYHSTQVDHPPSSSVDQRTSALECPPHARGCKDSLMENELSEQKRKMGSTRKSTGRFKVERKLEVRTTGELDEEYVTQPNTSTSEEQHASLTEEEQSRSMSFPSDLSLQTKSSGLRKEPRTTLMFAVLENEEKDAIHYQEITSHSHEVVSDMPIDEAMVPSVHSIDVKVAESDLLRKDSVMFDEPKTLSHQEIPIASTSGQKRRMGSTRRPLGGKNSENVGVQEHSRNMTENGSKAEVIGEAKFTMSEEMAQTWDDVARDVSSSHTESALVLNQSLLAERAELKEPDVSAGTETMNQSVAFPLVDSEKPLPETSSHHGTPLLNEGLDFKFGSHTEDFVNKVWKEAESHLSDNSQHVSDTRKDTNTSYNFRAVNTEAKEEVLKQKEELSINDQESSLSQHDIATLDNNCDCSMAQLIVGGSRSFDVPVPNISHAEPTATNLPHEMSDAVDETQDIHMEIKQESNVCDVASVTCDTLTDLECIMEENKDPQILAARENENTSDQRGSETDNAFEITGQGDVRDHNVTQIIMDVRDNEKDGETSTETIWISHQKACEVSAEKEELYKEKQQYSSNISQTHSPLQDDAGKMLETDEVRKGKKETAAGNGVTSKSEEMFSFKDSATDTRSHAHQQLFMQSPDKEGYDSHENVNEKSEKEGILFSVESENAAFDRGDGRSEGTEGIKEMDAEPVVISDGDTVYNDSESENPEQNRELTEEQTDTSSDTNLQVLFEGDTVLMQSDINIIPKDSHREEAHSKSSPVIHKRKMGSTRRPLKENKGQRKEHDEKEIFSLDDESRYIAASVCDISESQTLPKTQALSQEDTGDVEIVPAEGDTEQHLENKTFDSTAFEEEATEENICEASVLIKEVEFIGDTVTVESNMTTESDLIQNDTSSDAKQEALKVSDNAECEVQEETDAIPKQSDTTIIPEDTQTEEAHSEFTVIHKRKMGSTRRPLRGKNGQRKEKEHHDENETPDSEDMINVEKETISLEDEPSLDESTLQSLKDGAKEQEMEICEKNDVGPVEGSKSADLQSSCSSDLTSEESIAISICHITESQTLMKLNEESQENAGDAERVAVGGETDLHLEIKAQIKTSDSTSEAERTEKNIHDASVLVREVEIIGDTVTVESNMTTESDFLQSSPDALKVSQNYAKEVSGETETILKQSDINIIPEDSHREEARSKSSPVIHKRKMGSTRRPLKGNKGQRKEMEHHDENETLECEGMINVEKETFSVEDESSTNASPLRITKDGAKEQEMELCEENYVGPVEGSESALLQSSCSSDLLSEESTAVSICHVTESQTLMKLNEESQENAGDAEKVEAEEDIDLQLKIESQNKIFDSTTSEAEGTEENINDVSVTLVREVEVIGDTGTVESNMTTESDFLQTSPDAHIEALKISENAEKEVSGETDTILLQSDISIIPKDSHREEAHSKSSPVIHKRKMGSTRRPLKGNEGQRQEHNEKEIFRLEDEPSPDESRYTAVSICHITESQTLMKLNEESQENPGDAERVAVGGETDLHLEIKAQIKTSDSTSEAEGTEKNIHDANVLVREVEIIGDTVTVESNMTSESDFLQSSDALKAHSKSSPVIHKRKMGSTRRPLKGNKGQRKEHNEKEIFSLDDESRYIAASVCDISESQTLPKTHAGSQEDTGDVEIVPAEGDTERHLENKTFDSTAFEEETAEENICEASVLIKEVEFIGDTVTVESNMTTESDLIQNDTSSDAKQEALKVSDNAECDVQEDTDAIPKQSDTTIIPEDTQTEEAHSDFTVIHTIKMGSTRRPLRGKNGQRKGKEHHDENETPDSEDMINVEKETISLEDEPSLDESTLQSLKDRAKELEMEICEKNYVGPVEGSKSADLQSSCSSDLTSEESIAISICHITESQTLMKLNEESQENAGDAERVAVGGETDLHLEIKAQIKTSDSTSEAERTEKNIHDASVLVREVEIIGDTVTVESNMTTESDFLQSSPDALKVSQNYAKEVSGETDTILKQSDINIIPEDSHGEEAHSKSSPVIHKRKMGSTRRPLKGNKGQRKEIEHHDENETLECEGMINVEKETFRVEDESSTNASPLRTTKDGAKEQEMELCEENYVGPVEGSESALLQSSCSSDLVSEESIAISICHVTESQTLMKLNEESQENAGDAEKVAAEEDKDLQLKIESQNKIFDSTTSEADRTEENINDVSVTLVREVEVIGDTGTVESNVTMESDFLQTSPDAHIETLKISENAEKEVSGETDTILLQSDISIIPKGSHREEAHSKSSPVIHKRKMGSTRRPLKGNKGQRQEHNEKEIFRLEDEPSPDESRYTAVSICHITESQTLMKLNEESQENAGDAERVAVAGETDLHLEIKAQIKTSDSTSEAEGTEKNIHDANVLVREVEIIGDTVTVESNMTSESDFLQSSDALKAHSKSSPVIHKRKMGSTRRPLKGNKGQRKEHDEKEIFSLDDESRYIAASVCDISESQTLPKTQALSQEDTGDVEIVPAEGDTEQHLENKTFDSTAFEEEATEENICEASVLIKEVEFIGDTVTVESNMTTESDLIQNDTSSDAKQEALKVSDNAECEVQEETDAIPKQSDTTIIPEDTQTEEAHSDFTVIHKRKMGSTRRPLRGKNGQRKEKEHHDENETPDSGDMINVEKETISLEDEPSLDEPRYTAVSDISESQTLTKLHAECQEDYNDVESALAGRDTEPHSVQTEITTLNSATFEGVGTEEIICEARVVVKEIEFIGDTVTVESNMTLKSDLLQNDISTDAKPEALISEIAENEGKTDTIPKQSDANIIPEVPHGEEVHTKLSLNVQKRKMGSTRRPLKGNKGQRKEHDEKEIFILEDESRYTAASVCDISESQTLPKTHAGSQEDTGDVEIVPAEGDTERHLENKTFDSTAFEEEAAEENICEASVLIKGVEFIGDTVTVESNLTTESDLIQNDTSSDAKLEALKVSDNAECEVQEETDAIPKQSDTTIIPEDTQTEEAHSDFTVIHKRKMGSTRRPLREKNGQRKEKEHHDENETPDSEDMINVEKETISLEDEPSLDESTLQSLKDGAKELEMEICEKNDVGPVEGSESADLQSSCSSDLTSEESIAISICHITESQTLMKLNEESQENAGDGERVAIGGETDLHLEIKAQIKTSDSTTSEAEGTEKNIHDASVLVREVEIIGDTVTVESNMTSESDFFQSSADALKVSQNSAKVVSGETETILKQSDINIIPEDAHGEEAHSKSSPVIHKWKMGSTRRPLKGNKGQRQENNEKEIFRLEDEPSPDESRYTAVSICHITESQTLMKLNEESQENAGDAERVAVGGETDLHLEIKAQIKTSDSTSEAEGTEKNIHDANVLVREVEIIGDTVTVESNMTSESDFLQSSDALKAHSKSSPVIHKRKMGSTRRPLKGNKGQRKEHDEKEIFSLDDESRYIAASVCDISESQTLPKTQALSQEDTGDVEIVPAEGDTEQHLENKTFDSTAFEEEATEENICEASVLIKGVEFIGDTVTVESNMTTESDLIQNDTSSNAKLEALKVSDNAECEVQEETDAIPKQSDTTIIPEDTQTEEAHSDFTVIHKRKMGSTRRPLRGKNGQRKEKEHHDENETPDSEDMINVEKETISLEYEPSLDESTLQSFKDGAKEQEMEICEKNDVGPVEGSKSADLQSSCSSDLTSEESIAISICHITESQTLMKLNEESQENAGDAEKVAAEEDKDLQLKIESQNKIFDSTTSEAEGTEENINDVSVTLVREVEVIGDTGTVESNVTTESDLIQNDTSSDAKLEALKVSDNAECEVQEETDAIPKQSDTTIIPEDTQTEEAHSDFTVIHKRKMGSTRRPLRGKNGQRKEKEHHDENETPDSEDMINVEKETISLEDEPSLDEPRYTAVSDISESQTLTKLHAECQEDYNDVESALAGRDTEPHSVQTEITTLNSATFEGVGTEEIICEARVVVKEIEFIGDTVTVESNMTIKSDLLQNDISTDAKPEALISEIAENEGKTDTIPKQSDANIIPEVPHGEEVHTKLSLNVQKRKMGSTRRPLKGNKGQRKEHDEKEIFILEDESRYTAASVCDISESQTLPKTHAGSQEDTGDVEIVPAEGDTERHLENKTFDSTAFEEEAAEENICEASVLIKGVEFIGDTVTVESNLTTESDLIQNDTSSDAKLEALKVSDNAECEVQEETDAIPKQSDTTIIPEDTQTEEAHSDFTVIHKRKMGSTRRPLRGKNGQRKEKEHHDENETPDSEDMINVEKETISLEDEPSLDEPRYTAVSDISESQTLTKLHAECQEDYNDVESALAGRDTEPHSVQTEITTLNSATFEGEGTEEIICEASVVVKEIEFIGDTVTVESNMTLKSDLLQNDIFTDAKPEALISEIAENEGKTDTILKQSDANIIPEVPHGEEVHTKLSLNVQKRKMGSTRRPLKGNKGQRKEHDEKEIFILEDESRYTAASVCDISESQTLPKTHAGSQEDTGDVEIVPAEGDTEQHLENKTFDSTAFEEEAAEENICEASVLVKEVEFIGDTVTVESNMTTESDLIQNDTSSDAKLEALKVSDNAECEVQEETDAIPKQSDTTIIPEDTQTEEAHSDFTVIHKRKMGSTRRPLREKNGQRKEKEHHDENETPDSEDMINVEKETISLEDEPSLDESTLQSLKDGAKELEMEICEKNDVGPVEGSESADLQSSCSSDLTSEESIAISICHITESQTLMKLNEESQENAGDAERVAVGGETDLHLEIKAQIKTSDSTSEAEGTEKNIHDANVLVREVEIIGDTVTVESNMTSESDFLQSSDALKAHSKSSPVIHKRKMGSTRRPLKGNKGQRKEHDEKEIFSLNDESRYIAASVCDISESQTLPKTQALSQEDTGDVEIVPAEGDTEQHLENKTFDSTAFEEEATEENICEASVLIKEVEFIGDTVTVESNMTTESDLIQNDTSSDAKLEALKVSDNAECEVQEETDAIPKQSDTTIIPEDTQTEEAHSDFTVIHKRKMGSTRRPLRGKNGQRKEKEHHDENETPDSEDMINVEKETISLEDEPSLDESTLQSFKDGAKEQEMEICEKNYVGPVEGSKSADLQSSCSSDLTSEESIAISICHITESQTLMKLNEESQENAGDAEKVAAEEDKDLQLKIESQNKIFDSTTSEAEGTEENINDVSVTLVREVEVIGDTGTVESNVTTESDLIQNDTSSDAKLEALKVSDNAECEVQEETDAIPKQSDTTIIPEDTQTEEAHSDFTVIHKRKMGSTRRPLRGKNGQRKEKEHHDENETPDSEDMINVEKETISLEDEPSLDEPRYTAVSDISESQTLTKLHAECQEDYNDVESALAGRDTEPHSVQTEITTLNSATFEGEGTEEIICEARVVVKEIEFIGDTVTVESNMTLKSDLLQNDIFTDAKPEALISEIAENEGKTDTILKQSDANIIPEVPHGEEVHTKLSLNVQKRKMGSTRRPLKGNKGQRKEHDEKEIFILEDESRYTAASVCDISESQTLPKTHAGSQEDTGDVEIVPAEGDTEQHLENKTFDSTAFEEEAAEENICEASVLVKVVEFIGDTVTVESNMTTESDLIQNDTSSDAKLEALKVSDNAECEVQEETDAIPKQSDTTIIPEDTQTEEAHSDFTVIHKRKMGSTRRPLREKNGQRKEKEHHDENETPDSEDMINVEKETISLEDEPSLDESTLQSLKDGAKELEMEICEKNDVGPVEGSESADLQSSCSSDLTSEESIAISICHITESQTLMKLNEESQENAGDGERVAIGGETDLHLEIKAQIKTSDSTTSEAEGTEKNIHDASVLVREVEIIGDTVTVESNMTSESDFFQSSADALKVSQNSAKVVSGETETILKQSDINIIPEDAHGEEAHSKSSPVIHKWKMGSTRRPLKGNKGQRQENNEKEIFRLEDEPSPDESRYTAVSICHITESQTLMKLNEESQENAGDAERVAVGGETDLHLEIKAQIKTSDSTSEAEGTEKNIHDANVLVREVEIIGDTVTVESNMTSESDFLQSSDALKAHSKSSPVIHKRKMGSTRRPLKGNKGQRKEHDEKEIFSLDDESRYIAASVCDISESQTLPKTQALSQEDTGDVEIVPAEGDTEQHLENKTFDSTAFEEEATEENICEASVLIKEVEFIGDTVTVESNMTTESDLIQNDTSSDAKLEALKVSDNAECEVQEETDAIPKQSDTTIIPEDTQTEEAHSDFTVIHKRKMGSTRRPLRGKNGQRKEKEHHDENETPDSEDMINVEKETISLEDEPSLDESTLQSLKDGAKEQEMEICEKNYVGPVEGSKSADLQSSCSSDLTSEESIAISICHITESQTLMKLNEESQENAGDAEKVAAEEDKDLQLKIESQNKIFDSTTSEAEGTEENINDVSVTLVREVEVIGDTGTVESNVTKESDFLQTSPDAHIEALKISENAEKEVSGETDTILLQSDISIIPEDSHREEAHSKSSPVIHKRKMGSTRRPLKGNKGQRQEHDEKEIFRLEDEPSPDESRYTVASVCDISESQTLPKTHALSQENTGDVEIVPAEGDTEQHLENKTFDSTAFEEEAAEENICEASVLIKGVEFIGDTVTVESNMTLKSDLLQNDIFTDAKPEALISEIAENERKTDTIPKQSDANIIPEVPHREEVHTKLSLNVQKRKMGSTRRPLKGNKGQRKVRVESEEKNGDNEVLSEVEDTETRLEIQNQDNVVDHNVTQEIMNIRDNEDEERKTTKTVDMSVQELCDDLELEQRPDVSQTQTGPSQDDTGSYLLEVPERTADFVRDRFACKSHSDLVLSDALLIEETQIHVSSEDVPPKEMVEMHPVSKRSMQKRKMGSTRKRGKRMVNDEEVEEEKEGEAENTTNDDGTTKSEENLTIEEAIVGYPVHQQLFSSSADKEGHEIQDIGSKSDVQTEISEQNDPNSTINPELLIESECSSNVAAEMVSDLPLGDADTYLGPKQSVIPKESFREDQSSLNPVVQKRKMGSTRKTLRGNKGQGKEVESIKMDRDSEEMTQEQDTEPHLATSARKTECKFDEEVEQNFPVEFSYPVASSKMFSESENGVKEVSPNIHDLSEVSEEKGMESTGNYSNSENKAINLYDGTKDKFVLTVSHEDVDQTVTVDYPDQHVYVGSEPEQTENTAQSFPTQELKNTQDDVVYEISSTQEKRRKMGSTRRYPRVMHGENMANNEDGLGVAEDRETNKAEDDLDDMPLASSTSQSKEVSSVSTTDLESEILSSATDLKGENDNQNNSEPSGPTVPETPENTLQICDNQLVNADVTKHPQSETVTTEKRRKMGSTRKNLREGRIQGKRDGYEETETADTNLQMSQDSEMSLGEQTTHDYSNQSEDSLLREIERALNKTSQSSMSNDRESIVKELNPEDLANASDLNMSENSEIKSLQPTPLAHSEPNSPGRRRRKMGSTRKNPREQLKAEREDEDKEDGEKYENLKTNKQENKDLERVEVSIVHNMTENKLNKEYLDVSSAHTSSSQLEESTNPVSQEKTSPSTKRKFGSRRAKGKQGLGSLAASDFGDELEDGDHKPDSSEVEDKLRSDDLEVCDPCLTLQPENQPITHPVSEQRNMEAKNEEAAPKGTGAGLVSLDQIMKHDRSTGAKQTVNLKNRISDAEVVQFNVVMVGNSCVGKTSFIRRFHEGQFTEDYRSTIGVDTCTQTVALPDRTVQLQIWDTAGQERFHSITTQVFHKADGLLLMYEITCSNSFISVRDWISRAQKRAPDDVIMMLLGNKNDSVERAVQIQEGAELAREYNINFMECSAATGANVSESMRTLAELLMQRKSQKERHTTLRREPSQKKSGCC